MSSSYCSSCKIELQNDSTIREHYKGEFHRYNVKRKLVDLPPVTLDQFSKKKAELMAESSQSDRDQIIKCEPCGKSFASKATYKQHLESKKHRENLNKFNEDVKQGPREQEVKEERCGKTTAEDQNVCLFCNKLSENIEENLVHMRLTHSFFISEIKYLKDLKGLLRYLGAKIHRKKLCIQCGNTSNKETKTGEGVQQHMLAKGHIFMDTEDFGEYERFYDYSKVYEHLKKQNLIAEDGDAVIPEEKEEESDEEERSDENGSWEVVEDEENGDGGKKSLRWRIKTAQVTGTGELQLPNGQIIGHRQYKRVYKQYFREAARQLNMENSSQLEYSSEALMARDEENRLANIHNEVMRRERIKADNEVHKDVQRKTVEHLRLGLANNKTQRQHFIRRDLM